MPRSRRACTPTRRAGSCRAGVPSPAWLVRQLADQPYRFFVALSGVWLAALVGLSWAGEAAPVVVSPSVLHDDSFCLGCHDLGSRAKATPAVDPQVLRDSAHEALVCADCHRQIGTVPHQRPVAPVDCARCHSDTTSRTRLVPRTAGSALRDLHETVAPQGVTKRPGCTNCHGTHAIGPVAGNRSGVGRQQVARTCSACHGAEGTDYLDSVHGRAALEGNRDVPTCETCHPEHPRAPQTNGRGVRQRGVVATCVSCHEDPGLQERYAIPGKRLASYLGSYHGAATQLGYGRTANCASCHGGHYILPSSDPRSSVNPASLPRTCGRCHPGVTENVARGKIHILATRESASLLYYINWGFRWFTFTIIGLLMGHIGLDLFGRWRGRTGG